MTRMQWKVACASGALAVIAIATTLSHVPRAKAESESESEGDPRVRIGLNVAPVPLNMEHKNRELVGLGSYMVNVIGDCDGCHSAGPPTQFAPGGNPYFHQPEHVNPATYLGGGRDFGALIPGSAHIISRNLTPDASGRPIGGDTFQQFMHTIRTGIDPDHLHPPCTGAPNANCIPRPFDGNLLQIMPWPNLRHLSEHDLRAIYEYLRAVPCIQGNDPHQPANRCG